MLNFIEKLSNRFCVPVVLVGTPKAFGLFGELAKARRVDGQGDIHPTNFALGNEWEHFVEKLWRYQYTNVKTPLTKALSKVLYEESQGIADFAVKIYKLAQASVIGAKNERITSRVIKDVAQRSFSVARPILMALRNNDIPALQKFDDIYISQAMMDEYMKDSRNRLVLLGKSKTLENLQKAAKAGQHGIEDSPVGEISAALTQAGFPEMVAIECATQAVNRFAKELNLRNAYAEAFTLAANKSKEADEPAGSDKKVVKAAAKAAPPTPLSGDLREIFKAAEKRKLAMYDALREAANILPLSSFFGVMNEG